MLDFFEKTPQKAEHLPPSLHPYHLGDYLHTTMGGVHFLQDNERAVGRRGDYNHQKKTPRVAWPSSQNDPERIPKVTMFSLSPTRSKKKMKISGEE